MPPKKAPAFQLYVRDFLTDCQAMTPEEVGVYIRLLCYAWIGTEGAPQAHLVDDAEILQRLAGVSPEDWQRVGKPVMRRFMKAGAGLLTQKRLLETLEEQSAAAERRANAARQRWANSGESRQASAPTPKPQPAARPKAAEPEPIGHEIDGFQEFMSLHPNPGNEIEAMRAWMDTGPNAPPAFRRPPQAELMELLRAQVEAKSASGDPNWRSYFKLAKNWLATAEWKTKIVARRRRPDNPVAAIGEAMLRPREEAPTREPIDQLRDAIEGRAELSPVARNVVLARILAEAEAGPRRPKPWHAALGLKVDDDLGELTPDRLARLAPLVA